MTILDLLTQQVEATEAALDLAKRLQSRSAALRRALRRGALPPNLDALDADAADLDRAIAAADYRTGQVRQQIGLAPVEAIQ